ncbi:MAG TPA: cyclopropane-fatty-acyl-phospholipid synthase family protein [Thermoleophilaceae bacterium]|jgi:cyclopropane-fatty-acyl-phospholipid synthase
MALASTGRFRSELERLFPDRPFEVEFWDGTRVAATEGNGVPHFRVRSPRALAHALRAPGQLGVGRAYVSGDIDVDDMDGVIKLLDTWRPPPLARGDQLRLALAAARATGIVRPPAVPRAELKPTGTRRTRDRDARSVRHHYDLPPEFFALFLDKSMTYSCAIFSRGAQTLEEAQETKLELVCTKLGLKEGQRVLDVGCGWGSFALHAAARHGVHVTGVTLSEPQVAVARRRAQEAGLADKLDFRVMDYRELSGASFDAIASIGMVEHVGDEKIDVYMERLRELLAPGGLLLNHGIARLDPGDVIGGPFSDRYVFPDGAPLQLSRVLQAVERSGLEALHIEGFRQDYVDTLGHWARRLDDNIAEARRLAGEERVRVWRLYLRAARNGFDTGFTSVYQVLCRN